MLALLVDAEAAGAADGSGMLAGSAKLLVVDAGGPRRLESEADRVDAGQLAAAGSPAAAAVAGGGVVPACSELFLGKMWCLLKPGVASAPCLAGKLASSLADAGPAKLGILDEASGPDDISPEGEAGGSLGGLKPKIGLGLPGELPCCMLNDGIKLNGAGFGGVADTGLDALANILAGCSPFDTAATKQRVVIAKSNHTQYTVVSKGYGCLLPVARDMHFAVNHSTEGPTSISWLFVNRCWKFDLNFFAILQVFLQAITPGL